MSLPPREFAYSQGLNNSSQYDQNRKMAKYNIQNAGAAIFFKYRFDE